eukprot:101560_1
MINNGGLKGFETVFLPTRHNHKTYAKQTRTMDADKALNAPNHRIFWKGHGRCFSVNRPLNTQLNEKKAFDSILHLSPHPNTKHIHTTNQSSIHANITPNHKQYSIFMNHEYTHILPFIITNDLNCPLYLMNCMQTALNPEKIKVSKAAKQIMYEDANAGGCSELSEGFSFEILRHCVKARLVKTEMAIQYWWNSWKKTDYSIKIQHITIGVSVTRAMKYNGLFNKEDAIKLLTKKLNGINQSSIGVLECDEWQRQILHIWATDDYIERILHQTFLQLLFTQPELVGNTIILVTVASQDMWWIFYQDKYFKKQTKKKKKKRLKGIKTNHVLSAVT